MSISFYTAKQGVLELQKAMDVTSNNIANVSTTGFKPLRASFSDLIYTVRNAKQESVDVGHGVKIDKTDLMFDTGTVLPSSGQLDFATPTEGLFAIMKSNGSIAYTKDGSFSISQKGNEWHVVDKTGASVLDFDGKPIVAKFDDNENINVADIKERLGVFKFANPYGLKPDGNNYFLATASSGDATGDATLEKLGGYLEASSTNLADQMAKVIQYQRAFSFNTKMIQTADEIESIVNNLR